MKALRWHGRGDLRLDVVEPPRRTAPDDVIVAVTAAGICGTDIEEWLRGPIGIPVDATTRGLTLGHEICGVVAEAAPGSGVAVGDRVVVEVNRTCGRCRHCLAGQTQRCPATRALGLQDDGGIAERVRVPAGACLVVPDGPAAEVAVLAEPLAVAVHALRRRPPRTGDAVVVIGGGTVGQLVARLLRARGSDPLLLETSPARRALAARADIRVAAPDGADARALIAGGGADLCLEAAGSPSAIETAKALTGRGGTVVLLGVGSIPFALDPWWMVSAERTITASLSHTLDDMREAVDLLASGVVDTDGLITHRIALDDAVSAFELVRDRPGEVVKCVIEPRSTSVEPRS